MAGGGDGKITVWAIGEGSDNDNNNDNDNDDSKNTKKKVSEAWRGSLPSERGVRTPAGATTRHVRIARFGIGLASHRIASCRVVTHSEAKRELNILDAL